MGAARTETVSVLMTDLVDSTAIAERMGPAAAEDLRQRHFGLLRAPVEHTAGREVKNLGDGLMVVFDSAAQALACAVQMQQAVEAHNRRTEEQLGVRIGLSVGDATVEDGDYFGEPVVEAARLCAAARGGQIVLNDLVRRLGGARDLHRFAALGDLELKGLSAPVQAFELRWEALLSTGIALPERLRALPATGYVGRAAERERLGELWEEAAEGSLRLALISGEAGVGKTRLATHLALNARADGATVLYGRCDEDLGVPYQPWVQALGHLVRESRRELLDAHVARHGGDLTRLVSALRDRVAELPAPRQSDPETERYLLYAAVAGLLEMAADEEPLLLILDDLQWADQPTLSLLRHVVASGAAMRVMVIGIYRDSDLERDHPLNALLADLHREQGGERIKLAGLSAEDVLAFMEALAGQELDEDGRALALEITRESAGNPFFAGELVRHLRESGTIVRDDGGSWRLLGGRAKLGLPQSVREVTGRRVDRLGPDGRKALSAAAVIGRDFDLSLLVAVLDFPEARLLDLLDDAVDASLLHESPEQVGRFCFTHALVEHTLYEDLGHTRRALLHRQVAEALEQQCGDEPGERLGELAGHWSAAIVSADAAKAVFYARRAAEYAIEQLAPDEAARWYRRALELDEQRSGGHPSERCDLLIGLGEAQRQVGNPAFRETLLDAAGFAGRLDDTGRLCRAVLANSRGWASQVGAVDAERVRTLEGAARALPDSDARRGQVLALLASELHYSGDSARCRLLAGEATDIARAAGDPAALAHALSNACWAIWVPDMFEERKHLTEELVELAERLEDPFLSFWAASRQWEVGTETGNAALAEPALKTMRELAASVPQPAFVWVRLLFESVWALIRGDLESSEQWAIQAFEAGTASSQPDALLFFAAQIQGIRHQQGRTGELVEQLVQYANDPDGQSAWRAAAALALTESGRAREARELALAEDFLSVPSDAAWSATVFGWADVCCRLGLGECAHELHEMLMPFASHLAAGGSLVYGSIAWALGNLSRVLERYEQAERHFAMAAEIEERLGAPLFLARTRASWARALIARGRPEDLRRAQFMLERADDSAARLGGGGVTREVAASRAALAAFSG